MSSNRALKELGRQGKHTWTHSHWHQGRVSRHRSLFLRFLVVFGFLALLLIGGVSLLAFLISRLLPGVGETPVAVWMAALCLVVLLLILVSWQGGRAYRGFARPLADVMDTADAVAQGKLDARVPEDSPGEFGKLARTFNRMVRELELSDQRRRNLMADVAHELRTPLHILQGNLEGLLDGVYQPTPEQLSMMMGEVHRLGRQVEDLRTLSLAEAGQLLLTMEPVTVEDLLSDVKTSFGGLAEVAGIDFGVTWPEELSRAVVCADVGRLHQLFGNLIVNALRHTPPDGIVSVEAKSCIRGIRFSVSDTGPGIPAEDLPHVFDRYWRAERGGSGDGSGLGLAIARQLAELHGGHIAAESKPVGGTTLIVELPLGG